MKKEMLLSSLIATCLVNPGSNGWAQTMSNGVTSHSNALVEAAIEARLANATVYTAQNLNGLPEGVMASVLLLQPGGNGQKLYGFARSGDLEMIIRITHKDGTPYDRERLSEERLSNEYGNGEADDVYFYLRPVSNRAGTYEGLTCNSSQKCEKERFSATIDGDVLWITGGDSDPDDDSLPSFIKDIPLILKKS